ncbi:tetratricopeptide repeat protein [Streptomyces sp. NPDC058964]|uniref:tetratricopeptide repeat protein n=1 Tax=Streptomyces sp. NPDC058964 TaxID=3346681 RepID=UPI0036C78515
MSGDGNGRVKRPHPMKRAQAGPGPLRDLKDLLYELYEIAECPTLDEITAKIQETDNDDLVINGAPRRDTIRRYIASPEVPPSQADTVAIAVALARLAPGAWDGRDSEGDLVRRVRKLWIEARRYAPAGLPVKDAVDPRAFEVHPAIDAGPPQDGTPLPVLPPYIERAHDLPLREIVQAAAAGRNQVAVLVGSSSTGKTRACWEAIRTLPGWRLWHPINPTPAEAFLQELPSVAPHTVMWLNEIQQYLDGNETDAGERVAAGLREFLRDPRRGPVLVLGTAWPDYWTTLTRSSAGPDPHARNHEPPSDPHAQARKLLSSAQLIRIPDSFTPQELQTLRSAASTDPRLEEAAIRANDGEITQYLAAGPALLESYHAAGAAAQAVVHAAMDARRLGHGPYLSRAFLKRAAWGYLTGSQRDRLGDRWFTGAMDDCTEFIRNAPGMLARKTSPPWQTADGELYRLADYLEQYDRRTRPLRSAPTSLWEAASFAPTPTDQVALADAAEKRQHRRRARDLYTLAADAGDPVAMTRLAWLHRFSGEPQDAETRYHQALRRGIADPYDRSSILGSLGDLRSEAGDLPAAEDFYRGALNAYPDNSAACEGLMRTLELQGDHDGADAIALAASAADHSSPFGLLAKLVELRCESGHPESATAVAVAAVRTGDTSGLLKLGDHYTNSAPEAAEAFYTQAAEHGDTSALYQLASLREKAGDLDGAEAYYRQRLEGDPDDWSTLTSWARMREDAGDLDGAESLYRQYLEGHPENGYISAQLAKLCEHRGDVEQAVVLYERAGDAGTALLELGRLHEQTGHQSSARELYHRYLSKDLFTENSSFLYRNRIQWRMDGGDLAGALTMCEVAVEVLSQKELNEDIAEIVTELGRLRERIGDNAGAEDAYRRAAEGGNSSAVWYLSRLRETSGETDTATAIERDGLDGDHTTQDD